MENKCDKKEVQENITYCSAANGKILDKLMPQTAKKGGISRTTLSSKHVKRKRKNERGKF